MFERERGREGARSLLVGSALALVSLVLVACDFGSDEPEAPREPAPGFSLERLGRSGQSVALADHAGKTVILDFWATWCVPCEFQVPELNAFFDAHRSDADVALFGVSVDTEPAPVVMEWVVEKDVRYPILLDGDATARKYDLEGFPTVVIVRPDGTIDSRHAGLIQRDELEAILRRIRVETASRGPADAETG